MNEHIVLYQGSCTFCNWCKQFVLRRDRSNTFSFVAIESERGMELIRKHSLDISPVSPRTIAVLMPDGAVLYKWNACMEICRHLTWPMRISGVVLQYIIPRAFGDYLYDVIGRHRNLLCKAVRCKKEPR